MNERIQELAREAAGGFLSFSEDGFRLSEKEAVKFAQLIIKECAKVIDDHYEPVYDGNFLKDHFGVE